MTPDMLPDRLKTLPEYAFPRLRRLLGDAQPGKTPIDFSIGEPKHTPPDFVREVMNETFHLSNRYPPIDGTESFRAAIREWLSARYGLSERFAGEEIAVLPLNGTREGLFMAVLATTPERKAGGQPAVLVPNPFYQCYAAATLTAHAEPIYLNATEATGHLPSLDLDPALLDRCAAFFLCSPANPQGVVASEAYWTRLLTLAERHDFIVCADECYSEIYRGAPPVGVLEVAHKIGADPNRILAFHSLSKRSNLAGLRAGFVAGGPRPIEGIKKLKSYGGAPCPLPAIHAAEAAWRDEEHVRENRALYAAKFAAAKRLLGSHAAYHEPEAGFFLWIPVSDGEAISERLWREEGVKALPGAYLSRVDAHGVDPGARYLRAALVAPAEEAEEGLARLAAFLDRHG